MAWTCPDCRTHSPQSTQADTSKADHTPECRQAQPGFAGAAVPVPGWARKRSIWVAAPYGIKKAYR